VFIKHSHLLISLIMQSIFIKNTIERANVVVIGIANWEFTARDVDVMRFFLISSLENRWSVRHRSFRFEGAVSTEGCVESGWLDCLCSLRSVCADFVSSSWLTELLDIPHAHHTVIREGNDVVCNLGTYYIQRANRIFMALGRNTWTLNRGWFCT